MNGQCFGWRNKPQTKEYTGVIKNAVVGLRDTTSGVEFKIWNPDEAFTTSRVNIDDESKKMLWDYFQLDVPLQSLSSSWATSDPTGRFSVVASALKGMRIVRQDPTECLLSFICSSNNNIPRITLMLEKMRARYGKLLMNKSSDPCPFFSFPTPEDLLNTPKNIEMNKKEYLTTQLRELGFGYRASMFYFFFFFENLIFFFVRNFIF
eukprot:GSMAST32.ASY1.ANO1.2135.1 assembled CDS